MKLNRQPSEYPIIVHSHLGWDWVWQRPQQFLSRFSKRHQILFVEGPVPSEEVTEPTSELREVTEFPNITIMRSKMPASRWFDGAYVDKERRLGWCKISWLVRSACASATRCNGSTTRWR